MGNGISVWYYENGDKVKTIDKVDDNNESKCKVLNNNDVLFLIIQPVRIFSNISRKEMIKINMYWNEDDYKKNQDATSFYCDILQLGKELEKLRLYGTGLKTKEIAYLQQLINDHYRQIEKIEDTNNLVDRWDLDVQIQYIIEMIYQNIIDEGYKAEETANKELYHIPIDTFNEWINGSMYYYFSSTEIKEKLRVLNYTKCSPKRNDNTIKIMTNDENTDGTKIKKTMKVISFYSDKIEELLKKLRTIKNEE